jgi:hypothetical protein
MPFLINYLVVALLKIKINKIKIMNKTQITNCIILAFDIVGLIFIKIKYGKKW